MAARDIEHIALTNLGEVAPLAEVVITPIDEFGDPTGGAPTPDTADTDGYWTEAVAAPAFYQVDETHSAGFNRTFIDVPDTAGPHNVDDLVFELSDPPPPVSTGDPSMYPAPPRFFETSAFRGVPGFFPITTQNHAIDAAFGDMFFPMFVTRHLLFRSFDFFVVTASGGAGVTGRFAIYLADEGMQPAKLLLDSGDFRTDPAFTGLVSIPDTVGGLDLIPTLPTDLVIYPGVYLLALRTKDHDLIVRKWRGVSLVGGPMTADLGLECMVEGMSNSVTIYGAWPEATTWDTIDITDTDGFSMFFLIGWDPIDPLDIP